jgi:hypothetical protein
MEVFLRNYREGLGFFLSTSGPGESASAHDDTPDRRQPLHQSSGTRNRERFLPTAGSWGMSRPQIELLRPFVDGTTDVILFKPRNRSRRSPKQGETEDNRKQHTKSGN